MANLQKLAPFGEEGELRMVVETPRGSSVKLKYEAMAKVFTVARALPLGLTYPFDWGFIPGTEGDDGDPLDALAVHDSATYPGVVLPCRVLGVVLIEQKGASGKRADNSRFILIPLWHDRLGDMAKAVQLPRRLQDEIAQFFLSATFFTDKNPKLKGWRGPKAAEKLIRGQLTDTGTLRRASHSSP